MEHGSHVLGDAGFQQGQDPTVGAQLRDFPDDKGVDVGRQLGAVGGKRTGDVGGALGDVGGALGDVGGALGDGWACLFHRRIVRRCSERS
jgi:hypothetical protein